MSKKKKGEEPKRIITEHPELREWWKAITVNAARVNVWGRKRRVQ